MSNFIFDWDFSLLDFIQENMRTNFLDYLFVLLTSIGNYPNVWLLLTLPFLFFKKTRYYAIFILICYFSSKILCDSIKNLVQRERPFSYFPDMQLLIKKPRSFSFPSSHSMQSFSFATSIFLINKKWGIPCLILASLIAFSRLYLYVHFPTDVLIGTLLGILIPVIIYNLFKYQLKPDKN